MSTKYLVAFDLANAKPNQYTDAHTILSNLGLKNTSGNGLVPLPNTTAVGVVQVIDGQETATGLWLTNISEVGQEIKKQFAAKNIPLAKLIVAEVGNIYHA
jgi:hypothetical protein